MRVRAILDKAKTIEEFHDRLLKVSPKLQELDGDSLDLYFSVCDYVWNSQGPEPRVPTDAQERLLDLSLDASECLWSEVEKLLTAWVRSRSKVPSPEAYEERERRLYILLTWLDTGRHDWKRADKNSIKLQLESVRKIGATATSLLTQIRIVEKGYVTNFVRWWTENHAALKLEQGDLFPQPTRNLLGFKLIHEQESIRRTKRPLEELLVHLVSLSKAADRYKPTETPASQVGLGSNKKDPVVHFVVRMHAKIASIWGRPNHTVNAALASLVLDQEIAAARVKDIIKRARKERGEIAPSPSKKSTPP